VILEEAPSIEIPIVRETADYLNQSAKSKAVVTGNPVRPVFYCASAERGRNFIGISGEKPVLLVIGGSLGARQINELVENCIKHAFKGKTKGQIIIKVRRGEMKSRISISDNGIGMDERDFEKGSIGLQIVKSLVKEKLYGNLDIKTGNKGTDISFGFEN